MLSNVMRLITAVYRRIPTQKNSYLLNILSFVFKMKLCFDATILMLFYD